MRNENNAYWRGLTLAEKAELVSDIVNEAEGVAQYFRKKYHETKCACRAKFLSRCREAAAEYGIKKNEFAKFAGFHI